MKIFSRLVWRMLDWLDYRIWDARLRVADAVYGPEPETEAGAPPPSAHLSAEAQAAGRHVSDRYP